MKKTMILMVGIILATYCSAQDSINYFSKPNEINIGFFNILNLGSTNTLGIGYKVKIKDSALRVRCGFNYIKNTQNSTADTTTDKSKYSSIGFLPEIGYEFRINYKRSMLFYGLDLCGSYEESESSNSSNTYSNKTKEFGYGISPFIGYKFFINKNISIATETSIDFLNTKLHRETIYNNNTSDPNISTSDMETLSARLSSLGILSLNIHF